MTHAFNVFRIISEKIIIYFVFAILLFSLLGFAVTIATYLRSYSYIVSWLEWIWLFPALILFFLCIRIGRYFQEKSEISLIVFSVLSGTLCYFILILSYNTVPVSDYKGIWDGANQMASGVFTGGHTPSSYFYVYNWQIGITAFESIIIKIFGSNFFVLKILNIFILNLLSLGIYFIAKKKTGTDAACITYITTVFFLPYLLTVSQFTNQHISLLLLLVVFQFIEKDKLIYSFLAGIVLAILNVLRPIAIVLILAILFYWLYVFFRERKLKKLLINVALFLIAFSSTISAFDVVFIKIGYADSPVSQAKMPYFKFVKGLGGDQEPTKLSEVGYNYQKFNVIQKQELKDLITKEPANTLKFIVNKMCRYWGLFDYQFENTFNHDTKYYYQYPVKALYMISWFQYVFCILLTLIGYLLWKKKRHADVYVIFFIAYNIVYIFIEAFSSYRFIEYPFMLIMSGYAIQELKLYDIKLIWKKYKGLRSTPVSKFM